MPQPAKAKPTLKSHSAFQRGAGQLSAADVVRESLQSDGQTMPLVFQPALKGVDLAAWAALNRGLIEERLQRHGALLFRGFDINGPEPFQHVVTQMAGEPLEYRERSTPRSRIVGKVYTSTDYPASQSIFFHNENSYQRTYPRKLFFYCETPPDTGGATPLADCRRVLQRIDPEIRRRFEELQICYVRNLSAGVGLSWQDVFQTDEPAEVDAYCREAGISVEWLADGARVRLMSRWPAVVTHPQTGEAVWFNHGAFFHVSTLSPESRAAVEAEFDESSYPNQTYFGDGSRIEDRIADQLRDAYRSEEVTFPWRKHDLLLIDNVLVAHARQPYTGPRRILTAMADAASRETVPMRRK